MLKVLLNKDSHQKKLIFFETPEFESTGLQVEVPRKQLEDVETEHCKTWFSNSSIQ